MFTPPTGNSETRTIIDIRNKVTEFLRRGKDSGSHSAKLVLLTDFLHNVFGLDLEELLPGIEAKVGSKILGVRGRIDLLYQGTIVELKTAFDRELEAAKSGLKKYFQSLLEKWPDRQYVGLATDLTQFELFVAEVIEGRVEGVRSVGRIDSRTMSPDDVLLWLDAVLISGRVRTPTADDLCMKFGPGSPTFALALEHLLGLWEEVRTDESCQLKLRLWSRIMEIVYGTAPDEKAFVAQTYLAVLVKLLVYLRLREEPPASREEICSLFSGSYFLEYGLVNLVEEDFFSWILDPRVSERTQDMVISIARALAVYDLTKADEDLFKELYQEIVDVRERHATGEYYTPRWLCEYTVKILLESFGSEQEEFPRILDPACGSGSFLTAIIHTIKDRLREEPAETQLETVLSKVVGLDVNPVAVTVARANYAIALGNLLQTGRRVTIPVYVADSIKLPRLIPTVYGGSRVYDLVADGRHLPIPESVFEDPKRRVEALDTLREATTHYQEGLAKEDVRAFFLRSVSDELSEDEAAVLNRTLDEIMAMIDARRDSIWLFVLNNLYAPVMLKQRPFDALIGNPPWIVMRSIENPEYQEFLKSQVMAYQLLEKSQVKLYTHMEMSTLFFCKSADLYLREGGRIAFLMPISVITGAFHHANFNKFALPPLKLESVSSFRKVPGIFSLPPCILVAKKGETTVFPVPLVEWEGSLVGQRRNSLLSEVEPLIKSSVGEYRPAPPPEVKSVYFDRFREGATLVPRNFWYVEPSTTGPLGVETERPLLRTSRDVVRVAKRPWKSLLIKGRVEARFLYASYLGKDLIPFGTLSPRPVVLPLVRKGRKLELWDVDVLRAKGFPLMASWLEKAQHYWEKNRTKKSVKNYPRILRRLDHNRLLTGQDPGKRFVVIYNARGANAMCVVVDRRNLPGWSFAEATVLPTDFTVDYTNYFFETEDEDEAHYLCAVLNSPSINAEVKHFQPSGLYGKRDIGRRPLMLPIPQFDKENAEHLLLTSISKKCHAIVQDLTFSGPGFRTRRREAANALKGFVDEMDSVVVSLGMTEYVENDA